MKHKGFITLMATASILFFLLGCASSPDTTFLTLTPEPATTSENASGEAVGIPKQSIMITSVEMPSILDRRPLVTYTDGGKVVISENDQWAAPLEILFRETLSRNLVNRLPGSQVILPGQPQSNPPDKSLFIIIHQFALQTDGNVLLSARWGVDANPATPFEFSVKKKVGSNKAEAISRAMSDAIADFSNHIAEKLSGR